MRNDGLYELQFYQLVSDNHFFDRGRFLISKDHAVRLIDIMAKMVGHYPETPTI
ncbi:MAG: hypothetical protein ABFD66_11555 [Smithella sp.]